MKQLIAALCLFMGMTVSVQAQSLMEVVEQQADLSTFVTAVKAAELTDQMNGQDVTIFAPSNDAFAALQPGTLESLLMPENKDQLVQILSYHIVPGKMNSVGLIAGTTPTVQGEEAQVSVTEDEVTFNSASVITADVEAENGVVHIIDQVVMPPSQPKN